MKKLIVVISFLFLAGCERNPIDRIVNPLPAGAVPQSSGEYVIFDNEFKTGGGIAFIPGGENQSFSAQDQSAPIRSKFHIRYTWNGGDVTNFNLTPPTLQHLFAGFQSIVAIDINDLSGTPARDFSSFGYTKMTFYARGVLSQDTTVKIEGPSNGSANAIRASLTLDSSQLTSSWQFFTITVPPGDFSNIKVFVSSTFIYDQPPRTTRPGTGGVIYLDDLKYVQ